MRPYQTTGTEFPWSGPCLSKAMKRFLLVSALIIAAFGAFAEEKRPTTVVLAISGMHCEGCAAGITAMLKRTEGVLKANVSFEQREAVVEYEPAKTSTEKIIGAVEKMGYKAAIRK